MNIENVFIQIPTFVFWKNVDSVFLGCNTHFATSGGLISPEEIVGKTDYDLAWADTHADFYRQGDQEVLDGMPKINVRETQLRADGTLSTILINKVPMVDQQGQKNGVIGSYMELLDPTIYGKFETNKKNISLTRIQGDCLFYLTQGMSYKQIGSQMGLSWRTVRHYLDTVKYKLGCETKSDLIAKALTLDFIKTRLLFS